jgi:hypothetical protein
LSSILFHGPGARREVLNEAHRRGRLVSPPIGDDGLKVAEVRAIADLLLSTPVGMQTGIVVIGPMDRATREASDGLLKSVEDYTDVVIPLLWAHDYGEVSPTIRSRCRDRWCPHGDEVEDEELEQDGRQLLASALNRRLWEIPTLVKRYDVKGNRRLPDLLGVVADALAADCTLEALALWERLRPVLCYKNPTAIEVVAALVSEA